MHWYTDALKNSLNFSDRTSRGAYWGFILINFIISIVAAVLDIVLGLFSFENGVGLFSTLYALLIMIPSLAIQVRRLHDIERSGWWLLIVLVPLVGGIVLLVFDLTPGTVGNNRYGKDPREMA